MKSGDHPYIWQAADWPRWRYDLSVLAVPLAEVSRAQGLLMGRLSDVGMALRDRACLVALTEDAVKTGEIEGEQLSVESVRLSTARRLGVDIGALAPVDRNVEGVVEMVLDATANCHAPVSRGGWAGTPHSFPRATPAFNGSGSEIGGTMSAGRCKWYPAPRATALTFRGATIRK